MNVDELAVALERRVIGEEPGTDRYEAALREARLYAEAVEDLLRVVGSRSKRTGNLFRPGPNADPANWPGDLFDNVFAFSDSSADGPVPPSENADGASGTEGGMARETTG